MALWLSLWVVAGASLVLTGAVRRYALTRSMIDLPTARSSHSIPTPRGGGVAIVFSFLCALLVFGFWGLVDWALIAALLGAGSVSAILGFLDDQGYVAVRWRLLGHFFGAFWVLLVFKGLPPLIMFGMLFDFGWFGHVLALFYLVWMLNLYNFMDRIDGIAGVEAITVCFGALIVYLVMGAEDLIWSPLLLAMSVLGFLYWNFPSARIFMGDTGSGFLGIVFGVLSLQAAWRDPNMLWIWSILLGVFIVDSTFTLMRRFLLGARLYEAHCNHAYQIASRLSGKHSVVTISVLMINIFWLLPVALCVAFLGLDGFVGVIIAYTPLLLVAIKLNAGKLSVV
ncbi:glycosyltransferase family 4 protein [Pseudomonas chlororaphis subsp. aurantiaca]|uniref:MraY family glycosyltransferase n=1 Tax=Pseudomonas chlororaphis TaxID=587753 RepID=UPI0027DB8008|nr:glycosyltransferase family 4 protein [Pseudomonas chlororaphis]WMI98296.1 glycosyltransferase family 4 protein [Pseudomonas chlororaphis subsp. aurantiaca]